MITTLAVSGYRSLRDLALELHPLTVVTGANGSGKSTLYRALRLLAATARDGAIAALAQEGGFPGALWAGSAQGSRGGRPTGAVRSPSVALRLGFASDDFGYAVDLGLPVPSRTMFDRDPEIKVESVWAGPVLRPSTALTERRGPHVKVRDAAGTWDSHEIRLAPFDSMLAQLADPTSAAELLTLRERMRSWRFYDQFRTDEGAPARRSRVGTRTPVLGHDGADLAAAVQTILELDPQGPFSAAIDAAFPGARVSVDSRDGFFDLRMTQAGLLRPLSAAELSDGTLRYLLWAAALLSPRPAPFLVLNEPETSLHPELVEPLAGLVAEASRHSQILVVTHSARLIEALERETRPHLVELHKEEGETLVSGYGALDGPRWSWPQR